MTIQTASGGVVHTMHGGTFTSFVAPSLGSEQLCGVAVGSSATAVQGDVVVVPAGARFRLDTGSSGVRPWVVASVGLEAVTADGQHLAPPWTR